MSSSQRKPDIGYIPTEPEAVAAVLTIAQVTKDDVLYDLGCGDGRVLIAAAQKFGTRGVGIDVDPAMLRQAEEKAKQAGVSHLVQFHQQDLFETDFSDATVVYLYLLPHLNLRLLPALLAQLKPGSRIVSRDFDLGEWKCDRRVQVASAEEPIIYCWTIPKE